MTASDGVRRYKAVAIDTHAGARAYIQEHTMMGVPVANSLQDPDALLVRATDYDSLKQRVEQAERLLLDVKACGVERRTYFLCLPANIAYHLAHYGVRDDDCGLSAALKET